MSSILDAVTKDAERSGKIPGSADVPPPRDPGKGPGRFRSTAVVILLGLAIGAGAARLLGGGSESVDDDMLTDKVASRAKAAPEPDGSAKVEAPAVAAGEPMAASKPVPEGRVKGRKDEPGKEGRNGQDRKEGRRGDKKDGEARGRHGDKDKPAPTPPVAAAPTLIPTPPVAAAPSPIPMPTPNAAAPSPIPTPSPNAAVPSPLPAAAAPKPTPLPVAPVAVPSPPVTSAIASASRSQPNAVAPMVPAPAKPAAPAPSPPPPPPNAAAVDEAFRSAVADQVAPAAPAARPVLEERPEGAPEVFILFVAWSRQPGERLVSMRVGTGPLNVVHEGESVEGLQIATIHPESVDLVWTGRAYRVPMREF